MEVDTHQVTKSSVKGPLDVRKTYPTGIVTRRAFQRCGAMADVADDASAEESSTRALEEEKSHQRYISLLLHDVTSD